MEYIGYILLFFGLIASLYWQVRFLVIAYGRSLLWFFGCLFVPGADVVFFLLNFRATRKPFGLAVLAALLAAVGGRIAGII